MKGLFGLAVLVGALLAAPAPDDCGDPTAQSCPAVIISGGPVRVIEAGEAGSYTVELETRPAASVTITWAADTTQLSVTPSALTFTRKDWQKPQTFTVTAVDDHTDEFSPHIVTIEHSIETADPDYADAPVDAMAVAITDNDVAGVTLAPTALDVVEGGSAARVTVVLETQPAAAVVITPSAAAGQVRVTPSSLAFSPANWTVPQTFVVDAVDDGVAEGDHSDVVSVAAGSEDPHYAAVDIASVRVDVGDNDSLEVTVHGPGYGADGRPATFRATVNSQPGPFGYEWQAVHTGTVLATGDDPVFTFTPSTGGTYFVSVVVNDPGGATAAVGVLHTALGDIGESIFVGDILWAATAGITKGCNPPAGDEFCPEDPVTRGQMAAFLARALGLTDTGAVDFVDDDTSIFEADIEKLATAGITRGCNPPANDRFCSDDTVTRGQMTAFLRRALGHF